MKARKVDFDAALDAEVEALAAEFAAERKSRPHPRAPFPLEMLQRAVDLNRRAPKLGVFRRCQLKSDQVRDRLKVAGAAQRAVKRPATKKQLKAPPAFVAIPVAPHAASQPIVISVERGAGVRLTIEVRPGEGREALAVLSNLLGGV